MPVPKHWTFGQLVTWDELNLDVRSDYDILGKQMYLAQEAYCPIPGCG